MGSLESDTTERLHFNFSLSCIREGNGNPLQCSCLENPRDRGAWWAAVYGVAQSRTWLKRLSSSSSSSITYRRLAALRERMQCYLCLSWILTCFSPISPDPCMLCHQVFGSVLIRLPRCCLHSSPSCSSPSQNPLPPRFRMQLQVLKQRTGFFAACSHQPFQLCWICGSPFSPLPGEGNGNPLQYSCLENPMDRGACRATVHGVTHSKVTTEWLALYFHWVLLMIWSVYFLQ